MSKSPILEFRIALTVQDYENLLRFYQDGLGLEPAALWTDSGQARLYNMGRGTLELFDEAHAASVDEIETGKRLSGQIRFAMQVPDLDAALKRALEYGAILEHEAVTTPWGDYNVQIKSPDGMQITLFQAPE
jgi:predicted enzyme related to lactoylglutathione lyase